MDFNSLKDTVSNLSLYDLKAGVRKVQNAVMNYTEMEAKVREATNNEPWGSPSSVMQEIANGTFNYQQLNEIMPMIYKRFTEKSAEEWRQIYKALQLLEFLIKHGSERVVDDARSHLSLLKMLRQFHFIDQNGKDQGVNVRNRSKELVELLSDVDKIRAERKKARATRNKYGGYEGGSAGLSGSGMGGSSSSSYGGFGSESAGYGGYSGGVYGDGGGFGGQTSDYRDTQGRRDQFEEYDEDDDAGVSRPAQTSTSSPRTSRRTEPAKLKEPEVDLFSFDDPEPATSTSNGKAAATSSNDFGAGDDEDFDDFQSATPSAPAAAAPASTFTIAPPTTSTTTSATQFAAPQPRQGSQPQNLNALFSSISPPPSSTASTPSLTSLPAQPTQASQFNPTAAPSGYQPNQPNYYQSVAAQPPASSSGSSSAAPQIQTSMASLGKPAATLGDQKKIAAAGATGDAFASLLGGSKKPVPTGGKVSLAEAQRQKAQQGIWGAGSSAGGSGASTPALGEQKSGGMDDLLGL